MSPERKLQLLESIADRNPHMRLNNAMWKLRKAEKAEELRRPSPDPRGVVAMIRRLTGRA